MRLLMFTEQCAYANQVDSKQHEEDLEVITRGLIQTISKANQKNVNILGSSNHHITFMCSGYPFVYHLNFSEQGSSLHVFLYQEYMWFFQIAYDLHIVLSDSLFAFLVHEVVRKSENRLQILTTFENYKTKTNACSLATTKKYEIEKGKWLKIPIKEEWKNQKTQ